MEEQVYKILSEDEIIDKFGIQKSKDEMRSVEEYMRKEKNINIKDIIEWDLRSAKNKLRAIKLMSEDDIAKITPNDLSELFRYDIKFLNNCNLKLSKSPNIKEIEEFCRVAEEKWIEFIYRGSKPTIKVLIASELVNDDIKFMALKLMSPSEIKNMTVRDFEELFDLDLSGLLLLKTNLYKCIISGNVAGLRKIYYDAMNALNFDPKKITIEEAVGIIKPRELMSREDKFCILKSMSRNEIKRMTTRHFADIFGYDLSFLRENNLSLPDNPEFEDIKKLYDTVKENKHKLQSNIFDIRSGSINIDLDDFYNNFFDTKSKPEKEQKDEKAFYGASKGLKYQNNINNDLVIINSEKSFENELIKGVNQDLKKRFGFDCNSYPKNLSDGEKLDIDVFKYSLLYNSLWKKEPGAISIDTILQLHFYNDMCKIFLLKYVNLDRMTVNDINLLKLKKWENKLQAFEMVFYNKNNPKKVTLGDVADLFGYKTYGFNSLLKSIGFELSNEIKLDDIEELHKKISEMDKKRDYRTNSISNIIFDTNSKRIKEVELRTKSLIYTNKRDKNKGSLHTIHESSLGEENKIKTEKSSDLSSSSFSSSLNTKNTKKDELSESKISMFDWGSGVSIFDWGSESSKDTVKSNQKSTNLYGKIKKTNLNNNQNKDKEFMKIIDDFM